MADLKPSEFFAAFEKRVVDGIASSVPDFEDDVETMIRRKLPGDRIKTRRAVDVKSEIVSPGKIRSTLRLIFNRRYKSRNTITEQLFERVFDRNKDDIKSLLDDNIKFEN